MIRLNMLKAWKSLTLVMLLALLVLSGAAGGLAQSGHNPSVDSALEQLMQMVSAAGNGAATEQFASQNGIPVRNGQVQVVVQLRTPGLASSVASSVRTANLGVVRAQSVHFLSLQIPLSYAGLLKLAGTSGVGFIRAPLSPQALTISEGVSLTGAAALQSAGIRGQGVKIAVIDLGFAGLSNARGAGELPNTIVTQDFTGSGLETGTSHGTGVAEIVYNMAPAAQLYLYKVGDEVDLENAVDQAINQGIQIINHSVGWLNTNFYDGTGIIDDAANRARARGILWVSSAGNYGQRHWQGLGVDQNGDGWVDFSPGNPSLTLNANTGDAIQIYLTWNDWPATAQDYDLFLFDANGVQVASSERLQTGTEQPTENIFYSVGHSGIYSIRVKLTHVSVPKQLAIFSLNHDLSPSVPQSSIVAPADAQTVLAVGAIDRNNWSTGPQESYSSQGPTTDGRTKPDLMGPDNVSTFTLGAFLGTSAAAPHVAGAAALLLGQNPGQSADQLTSQLLGQAINMGSPFIFGSGRLNLTSQAPPPGLPDLSIRNLAFSPPSPRVGDLITVSGQVLNQGTAAAGAFAVQINDGFGTDTQNFAGLAARTSLTFSFNRQLQAPTETITVTADPFNQVTESDKTNNTAQLQVSAQTPQTLGISIQTDRSSYQIGDPIRVQFSLTTQAFVYLYDVDALGTVTLLFPSSESASQALASGSYDLGTLLGGMSLRVNGPVGLESVHALATSNPINLQLNGLRSSSFTDVNTFHNAINQRIQAINPTLTWAWSAASFQVGGAPPVNQPPVASFTFSPSNPQVNQVVTFDGSSSSDPNGFITNWHWIFQGDTRQETDGVRVQVQFTTARTYQVTLTVTDNQGATNSMTQLVQVTAPPPSNRPPVASFTFSPSNPQVNQVVTFDGSSSLDPDGFITSWHWVFLGDTRVETDGVRVSVRFTTARTYQVTLTVTDNRGATNSVTQMVQVTGSAPPPSTQAGFFLSSQDPDKFHLIVRGDPSWTTDHAFQAKITLTGVLSGSIDVKVTGNATAQTTHYSPPPTILTGTVRDGMIEYVIPISNPGSRFDFDLQMDLIGNVGGAAPKTGTAALIFFVIGGQNYQVLKNPFFIMSLPDESLLPFSSFILCTYSSPTRTSCMRFPPG
jgi:PKD repeat protein